jgi:hypothetical protein
MHSLIAGITLLFVSLVALRSTMARFSRVSLQESLGERMTRAIGFAYSLLTLAAGIYFLARG